MISSFAARAAAVTVSVAVAAALTGCGERAEPTGPLAAPFPVTAEGAAEEQTVLEAPPSRIVALDVGSAEIIEELGAQERLVGTPASSDASPITETGEVDIPVVVSLEPDLIVATSETDPIALAQAARETGAAIYVRPSRTVELVVVGVVELGALLGSPADARVLAGQIVRDITEVEALLSDVEVVTVFVDRGLFVTIPDQSILGDLIRRARGRTIVTGSDLAPVDPETLAQQDPDVYLATSDSDVSLQILRDNVETSDLAAVRTGRFAILPVELLVSPGPDVAADLRIVAAALHPDALG
jgi:iron complex transport system substrate-binding protein